MGYHVLKNVVQAAMSANTPSPPFVKTKQNLGFGIILFINTNLDKSGYYSAYLHHPTLSCSTSCKVVVSTLTQQVRDVGSTPRKAQCLACQEGSSDGVLHSTSPASP